MNPARILALVFFLMVGYGLGVGGKLLPTMIAFGGMVLMVYGDRVFKRQDAAWDKADRAKQSLILASEHMLKFHECEVTMPGIYFPQDDLQVAD